MTEHNKDGEAEPWDLLSQALGSLDDLEEDEDYALDVSEKGAGVGAERFSKVPLEQAENLLAVRSLAAGIKDGSVTIDVFRSRLKLMVRSLEDGLKVVSSEAVQPHLESLPADQRAYFDRTAKLVEALVQGGQKMLSYADSRQMSDLDGGLGVIEKAFRDLDELQDQAIEIGREIAVREAATEH